MTFTYDKDRTKKIQVSTCNTEMNSNQYKKWYFYHKLCLMIVGGSNINLDDISSFSWTWNEAFEAQD